MLKDPLTWRYPDIKPYHTGRLPLSGGHELYYEQSGRPDGKPVVFIHGGPGGGTDPGQRRFFDPRIYRIVLFDQRGCGKSTPYASLENNTTWDLVADIEALRQTLGIDRWQVFGGSWGSTLSLAYAQTHPERVTELVLRGIFLGRRSEIAWLYQRGGASEIFPDAFEAYESVIPHSERGDMIRAYHARLTNTDPKVRGPAAVAWSTWEGRITKLLPSEEHVQRFEQDDFALAFARIECHYFVNDCFLKSDDQLLRGIDKIRHIPAAIVHGRYDICCPVSSAWELHRAWLEAELLIVPDGGHAASEPGIARGLVAACDRFGAR